MFGEHSEDGIKYLYKYAKSLVKKHREKGRPEFSDWNKCAKIPENRFSAGARFNFNKILKIMTRNVSKQQQKAPKFKTTTPIQITADPLNFNK